MGSAPVGLGPRLLARSQARRIAQAFGCTQALESAQPMVIVTRAVVGLTAARGGAEFIGQRDRPFLPSELPLLRELDCERERFGLPRFGKHRVVCISRKAMEYCKAFEFRNRIRLAQGSRPTYRRKPHRAARPGRPTVRSRRSGLSTRAAASRRENGRWCRGTQRHRGL